MHSIDFLFVSFFSFSPLLLIIRRKGTSLPTNAKKLQWLKFLLIFKKGEKARQRERENSHHCDLPLIEDLSKNLYWLLAKPRLNRYFTQD